MKVTAAIARQLQLLCDDFDDADRLATGLTELGARPGGSGAFLGLGLLLGGRGRIRRAGEDRDSQRSSGTRAGIPGGASIAFGAGRHGAPASE